MIIPLPYFAAASHFTPTAFGITHQISRYRTNRCYGNCRRERSSGNILGGVSEWECSIYILHRPVITGQHRPVITDELSNKGTINCRGQWPSPKQEITIMNLADALWNRFFPNSKFTFSGIVFLFKIFLDTIWMVKYFFINQFNSNVLKV